MLEITKFYNSLDSVCIEQDPAWWVKTYDSQRVCYFIMWQDARVVCYSAINLICKKYAKFAHIHFGPLFRDADVFLDAIRHIRDYLKKNNYIYLSVQLPLPTGAITDYIEAKISQQFSVHYSFDRHNWSSLRISLSLPLEEIYHEFSTNHKRSIHKAQQSGFAVIPITTTERMKNLSECFVRMNERRDLYVNPQDTMRHFENIFEFLQNEKKGISMAVIDPSGALTGGVILIYQGNTVRFYKGAADPDKRKLPILHLAFWEAIKISQELGFKYFDLWGYNHYVNENDQIYYINKFKKGFGGEYVFYPKLMHINLMPFGYFVHKLQNCIIERLMNPLRKLSAKLY